MCVCVDRHRVFTSFCSLHFISPSQELFVRHGGEFLDRRKVIGIVPGPVVTVQTEKGGFKAKRVILTVGPWTNSLLMKIGPGLSLPLQVRSW